MKSALFLLNALALAALVSFHSQSDNTDVAEVHFNAQQMVHRPVAQLAVMHAAEDHAALTASESEPTDALANGPRADHYTF